MQRKIIPTIVRNQEIEKHKIGESAARAAKAMVSWNIAAVVVVDDEENLIGIVTERDITRKIVAEGKDPEKTTLGEIMTPNPDTLKPDDHAGDALELMRGRRYRHLPVCENGKVVGMVSIRDLYEVVKQDLEKSKEETEAFVFGDRYSA